MSRITSTRFCIRNLMCGASAAVMLGLPIAAEAQINEIIVTAAKREQRLIDVPISLTAFSNAQLRDQTVSDLTDIGSKVPNLITSGGNLAPGFTIRGISSLSGAEAGFPPAIGIYVDEVFLGRDRAFNTVLNDIERVEVLRGPQGTLYGKNTIAGTINITTRRPSNDYEVLGDLTIGNLDLFQARGTVSGPIIEDKLKVRLSGIYKSRDGFIHNRFLDEDLNEVDAKGWRVLIVSDWTENIRFELAGDYYQQDGNSASEVVSAISLPSPPFNFVPPQDPTDRIVDFNTRDFDERELYGIAGRLYWDIGGYELASITSYRKYTSNFRDDSDLSPNDQFDVGRGENVENFSQEIRLTSPDDGRFSWILGAYYYSENLESLREIRLGDAFPVPFLLPPGFEERATTTALIENTSWAIFGSSEFDITDQLTLNAGLRFTHEEKDLFYEQLPTQVVLGLVAGFALPIPALTDTYSEDQFSGDVSLSYEFMPDHVAYVKYSRGFKAGGFQADVISPPPFTPPASLDFDPEFVDNYEIGYKSSWWDNRVLLNLSAFYLDFSDKQERVNTGISFIVSNAAAVTSYGGEIELQINPIEGLDIFASAGFLHAEYDDFPNGGGLGVDFDGNELAGAPDFNGSIAIQYVRPIAPSAGIEGYIRAEIDHVSEYFTEPSNDPTRPVDASTIFNARGGFQDAEGRWGIYGWGKNLADETVQGGGVSLLGLIAGRSINIGRTYGVEVRFAF